MNAAMDERGAFRELQASVDRVLDAPMRRYLQDFDDRVGLERPDRTVIRDAVWGFHVLEAPYRIVIDAPFFQRLRHLRQTALSHYTYPTMTHSRFEHSLGVFGVAGKVVTAVSENSPHAAIEPYHKAMTQLAALVHDVGHGPFSHVSEDVYGKSALMTWAAASREASYDSETPASEILAYHVVVSCHLKPLWKRVGEALDLKRPVDADALGRMIVGTQIEGDPVLNEMRRIVNGPYDADKLDWMTRDSYYSGVKSAVDIERIVDQIRLRWHRTADSEMSSSPAADSPFMPITLAVDRRALAAYESLIMSRAQLFAQIYSHHKVRAATVMLHRHLRSQELLRIQTAEELNNGATYDPSRSPAEFLALDEIDILQASREDGMLDQFVRRLKDRRLPHRALVVNIETLRHGRGGVRDVDPKSRTQLGSLLEKLKRFDERQQLEARIARHAKVDSNRVFVDRGPDPGIRKLHAAKIIRPSGLVEPLDNFFPADTAAALHDEYRGHTLFVFADATGKERQAVGWGAAKALRDQGIELDRDAFAAAHIDPPQYVLERLEA